ncbi:MAG: hypothetical protein QOF70_922 [Acetobacteraceae bacterium]|jgi:hypothetical protein|nr:hypothetical protein [Rhodopila sp.]MEA2726447.1 hypothetical protein [Acetobacteraceae bacterium]MEA2791413.1 hypothetical protein [Acetobacteraceae bacterium]
MSVASQTMEIRTPHCEVTVDLLESDANRLRFEAYIKELVGAWFKVGLQARAD